MSTWDWPTGVVHGNQEVGNDDNSNNGDSDNNKNWDKDINDDVVDYDDNNNNKNKDNNDDKKEWLRIWLMIMP